MKKFVTLLAATLLATTTWAYAPHPSVLTAKYKKQMRPVLRVIGTDPVVSYKGKETRIRHEPTYLLQRAPGYSDARVTVNYQQLSTQETKFVPIENTNDVAYESQGARFGKATFNFRFSAQQDLRGGFVVVVIYSPSHVGTNSAFARPDIVVHDLPFLPRGIETSVKFGSAIPDGRPDQTYFAQVFDSEGREVFTNVTHGAWSFYRKLERRQLKLAIANYQKKFAGQDRGVAPVVRPLPIIKPGATLPAKPIHATLSIAETGLVTDVDLPKMEDTALWKNTHDALKGWMFFPRLKSGKPAASKVQVPIQF